MPNDSLPALRSGPPTREELDAYYPGKFTWEELRAFVNSGDLGLLKRDKQLQQRYSAWSANIKEKYGSIVNYLLNFRLQWGKPDALCLLPSALNDPSIPKPYIDPLSPSNPSTSAPTEPVPVSADTHFTADTPFDSPYISIITNDWPYSVPADVEHSLVWTRLPLIKPPISARVQQDGLWGFTGNTTPPGPYDLTKLAEWGVTEDNLVRTTQGTPEEDAEWREKGKEVEGFVKRRWNEDEWETAWFVNPPRLQSVPGLAHVHVFAKKKDQTK